LAEQETLSSDVFSAVKALMTKWNMWTEPGCVLLCRSTDFCEDAILVVI